MGHVSGTVYFYLLIVLLCGVVNGRQAFEKLTDLDFRGTTYYTIRNLTLYECQGWCREEPECAAASFSFVANPLAPIQETLCLLQNDTEAIDPTVIGQKVTSSYYFVKLDVDSENVCNRPWTFERVPNKLLRSHDDALLFTSTKEGCLAACLDEERFLCRSVEYNFATTQCHLSRDDRRTVSDGTELVDAVGIDYFENSCLKGNEACNGARTLQVPDLGIPNDRVALHTSLHFYPDKEFAAGSLQACQRACQIENEFLCRSGFFREGESNKPNCRLYHLDHWTLPDGVSSYLGKERPLLDDGESIGTFFENSCQDDPDKSDGQGVPGSSGSVTDKFSTFTIPDFSTSRPSADGTDINCDSRGICYDVSVICRDTKIEVAIKTSKSFSGRVYALGRSETCNVDIINSDSFRLDLTMNGQDCNTQSINGQFSNTIVVQHHSVVMTKADKIYKVRCTYDMSPRNITFGMMPIRDPDMISITSAPEAPPPRIRILDPEGKDVETVRIGDRLSFRIEIPEDTPYGIFARSCIAMAKDSRTTFQIVDDDGCPVDPLIFPRFIPDGNNLQSSYEAFRFTESYGVIFQCNVRYCLGQCEPAKCPWGSDSYEAWGRKRRSISTGSKVHIHTQKSTSSGEDDVDVTLSREVLVLDIGEEPNKLTMNHLSEEEETKPSDLTRMISVPTDATAVVSTSCPTRTSVFALAATCVLLLILYVATMTYILLRKWSLSPKDV
ncbi:uncharacterized protein LOC136037285 [Artemia franciscana]|uniref:Cuticlin-1 n=1 Tax=Artemia franciscana TaxID=6661 RepID=A0AA88I1L1_ARTSF|nr:hypothetical protein QYM36_005263 [Artemia franciscana]